MTTAEVRVLCPQLYRELQRLYGTVQIANEGETQICSTVRNPLSGRLDEQMVSPGEYYRVCCPFCDDQRHRLWVNYQFGQFDSRFQGKRRLHLAVCYNEGCLQGNPDNRQKLADSLFTLKNRNVRDKYLPEAFTLQRGRTEPRTLSEVQPPGTIAPLSKLPADHVAVRYLLDRGYTPETFTTYGLGYCVTADPRFREARGRIIIPLFMHGKYVGWQGRWPADVNWKAEGIAKYYTMPGLPRGQLLYNYDRAREKPYVVVVEGVTDTWRSSDYFVACLGGALTHAQRSLLASTWRDRPIVLLPDGGQAERDTMTNTVVQLEALVTHTRTQVIPVRLPDGYDPDDMAPQARNEIIYAAAAKCGVKLPPME